MLNIVTMILMCVRRTSPQEYHGMAHRDFFNSKVMSYQNAPGIYDGIE